MIEIERRFLKSDRWDAWRTHETDQRKGVPSPPPQKPYPEDATLIELVAPGDLTVGSMPLITAIMRRRSRREYTEEPLTLEELSFLLWATQGIDEAATRAFADWLATKDPAAVKARSILRTVPSAGGRHPFETYLLVQRVRGLQPGLYRYLAVEHKLLFLRADPELAKQTADAFMRWVQRSGETEPSAFQGDYPPAPPRVFYILTGPGWKASKEQIADPVKTLYGYSKVQRSSKKHLRPKASKTAPERDRITKTEKAQRP